MATVKDTHVEDTGFFEASSDDESSDESIFDQQEAEDSVEEEEDDDDDAVQGMMGAKSKAPGEAGMLDVVKNILKKQPKERHGTAMLASARTAENRLERQKLEEIQQRKRRTERARLLLKGRTKPGALDRPRERKLLGVATKGVVKLFNTVKERQLQKQPGQKIAAALSVAAKTAAPEKKNITKTDFLDILKGGSTTGKLDTTHSNGKSDNKRHEEGNEMEDEDEMEQEVEGETEEEEESEVEYD
eukprot:Clim_evm33s77 gene=Clim_evmTU33s77